MAAMAIQLAALRGGSLVPGTDVRIGSTVSRRPNDGCANIGSGEGGDCEMLGGVHEASPSPSLGAAGFSPSDAAPTEPA